jgi:hypothetical protein
MNLRELMQTLVLIPFDQDIDVLFRTGDNVAKLEGVSLLDKGGKFTLELNGQSTTRQAARSTKTVLRGKSYTLGPSITNREEIKRITGCHNRHQIREDGIGASMLRR